MQFNNYGRKAVSYEKQMQIAENKKKVEMTLDCIRSHLPHAIIHNVETDSLCKQLASVVDLANGNDCFINMKQGPKTKDQKRMMENIELINTCAQDGIKMNFIVDMERKKYISAYKEEDIGLSLCSLYPVNASKPIVLLTDESQRMGLYAYVGVPSNEGLAYIFSKDDTGSLFVQLQEFHFLSLRKDPVHNFDHGLLLSYNHEWGWKNISFSIILKENQDMVRQLFDSVRSPMNPMEQPDSSKINMGTADCFCPWQ